jgi:hypothetical protein
VANLIPSLVELKLDLLSRKAEVRTQLEGRKAAPLVRKTVKLGKLVPMNRSNLAEFPLASVSEVLGTTNGQGRKALAKKTKSVAREERAAERAFVRALGNFLVRFACCPVQRAEWAKKASTGSRARLIASDVLAAPAVETAASTVNRPRWAHVTVEAPKGQAKAAITREKKRAIVAMATRPAWDSQARMITPEMVKAAKLKLQQKRSAVMAVISAIFSLLAEKRELQARVNWHFQKFSKAVALDITVELRAQIQLLNEQLDKLVLGLKADQMRFMAFKAYRMVTGQVKAALKREAKASEAYWRKYQDTADHSLDSVDFDVNCTFNENVFVWSMAEILAA